jgi:hypothetical protein
VTDTRLEGRQKNIPAFKVPRQCPLVPLVGVRLRKCKALGSEEGKALGNGLRYEQRKTEILILHQEDHVRMKCLYKYWEGLHVKRTVQRAISGTNSEFALGPRKTAESFDRVGHNKITYNNSVRTSQETHYVSTTKPNRLMLFGETIAVYCENHKEHMNHSVWAECRISEHYSGWRSTGSSHCALTGEIRRRSHLHGYQRKWVAPDFNHALSQQ